MKQTTYKAKDFPDMRGERGDLPHALTIVCRKSVIIEGVLRYEAIAKLDGYQVGKLSVKMDGEISWVDTYKKLRRRRIASALKLALQRTLCDQRISVQIRHSNSLTDAGAAWASFETGLEYEVA